MLNQRVNGDLFLLLNPFDCIGQSSQRTSSTDSGTTVNPKRFPLFNQLNIQSQKLLNNFHGVLTRSLQISPTSPMIVFYNLLSLSSSYLECAESQVLLNFLFFYELDRQSRLLQLQLLIAFIRPILIGLIPMDFKITQLAEHNNCMYIFPINSLPKAVEGCFGSLRKNGELLSIYDRINIVSIQVIVLYMLYLYPIVLERDDIIVSIHLLLLQAEELFFNEARAIQYLELMPNSLVGYLVELFNRNCFSVILYCIFVLCPKLQYLWNVAQIVALLLFVLHLHYLNIIIMFNAFSFVDIRKVSDYLRCLYTFFKSYQSQNNSSLVHNYHLIIFIQMSNTQPQFIINQLRPSPQQKSSIPKRRYQFENPENSAEFSKAKYKGCQAQQNYINRQFYLSETEKKMFEHPLVQQIVQKSKAKTVHHSINKIDKRTQLYASPLKIQKQQISTKTGIYSSACSRKVSQIYQKLNDKKSLAEKFNEQTQRQKLNNSRKKSASLTKSKHRPKSAQQNLNKRISVSGLVTYSFNSVNAKKSLGFNPNYDKQDLLRSQLAQLKRKNACMISRRSSIIKRKPNRKSVYQQSLKNAAASDFTTGTDVFLKVLKNQFDKDQQIYGQKLQKLKCIQDYMHQQKVDFDDAQFIVNDIAEASKGPSKSKQLTAKYVIDEQTELRMKKKILNSKRVMLRHLYFIQ